MSDEDEDDPHGLSRREDPDTSKEAGADVPASKLFGIIYLLLLRFPPYKDANGVWRGGLTNSEISWHTGIQWNTCTPRMRQMADRGWCTELIVDGVVQKRFSPAYGAKKPQMIWVAIRKEGGYVEPDNRSNPRNRRMARPEKRPPNSLPLFRFYNSEDP